DHRRMTPVADVFEEHHELIPAEAGDGVPRPQECFQPSGEGREQLIAYRMAQAVVDDLEAVDVEEKHGEGVATTAAGDADGPFQAVLEQGAAGEIRETVPEGIAAKLLLVLLPLGDVGQRTRNPARLVGPASDGEPAGQDPSVRAVPLAQTVLELEM